MPHDSEDKKSHLVVVNYSEEAERKRAEYLFDNWDDGTVESLRGISRLVSDVEIEEMYEQLVSKVPQQQVEIFEVDKSDTEVSKKTEPFEFTFDADHDKVEWAIEAIMNKRKRVTEDAENNVYGVYTKKGRATISYTITELPNGTVQLTGEIVGFGEAPEFLHEYITDELDYMV